jgi:phospholipid/cholesterol/gamma-HCH transport system permease protein
MIRELWYTFIEFLRTFGKLQIFFVRLIINSPSVFLQRGGLIIKQVHNAGSLSLVIIMVCGLFVGGVLGLQGFSILSKFNAEDSIGTFAAFSLLKELGPVITALLFAGRAGTARPASTGAGAEIPGWRYFDANAYRGFQCYWPVRCAYCWCQHVGR